MNGKCNCWEGYIGADCYIPINCGMTCKNACAAPTDLAAVQAGTLSDGASTACFNCVGQCMTSMGHPVLGVHNPFEDLKGTFLQENHTDIMPTSPRRRNQYIEVTDEHLVTEGEAAHHGKHHNHHHKEVLVEVEKPAAHTRSPNKRSHKHREVRVTRYGLLQKKTAAKKKRRHHKEVSAVRIQ